MMHDSTLTRGIIPGRYESLVYNVEAEHIAIYRAGDYGILILVENRK